MFIVLINKREFDVYDSKHCVNLKYKNNIFVQFCYF